VVTQEPGAVADHTMVAAMILTMVIAMVQMVINDVMALASKAS